MVITQLRATIVVRECYDSIYAFAFCFFTQAFSQLINDTIHTTHRRDNPHLITDTHLTIRTTIAFECSLFIEDIQCRIYRAIGIVQESGKISLNIVFIHPFPTRHCLSGVSNGIAIFDDVFALREVFQGNFMSCRNICKQYNFTSVHLNARTRFLGCYSYCYIVSRIDFQDFSHIISFKKINAINSQINFKVEKIESSEG